jgi:hypothetical protein
MSRSALHWLLRHRRLLFAVHRLAHHWTPKDVACRLCAAVWGDLERDPAFREAMAEGLAHLKAGRFRPWRSVRRELWPDEEEPS